MRASRIWPKSLGGQTVAILVAAVVLVHLASMLAYREFAVDAANTAQTAQLAERLASAVRAIVDQPPAARDQVAHDMSSAGLFLQWSEATSVEMARPFEPGMEAIVQRLSSLFPALGPNAVRIAHDDRQPPGDVHAIIGSVQLPDASFVSFKVSEFGEPEPALHATVLSTSLMAGGVAVVAILLVRTLVLPLRNLAGATDAIGRGPAVAVAETGPDEVRHVARAFNAMQARIHHLISDRTHALAAVSHDLRTPITRLRLRAGFLADTEAQAAMDADLDEMEAMIDATLAYLSGDAEPEAPKPIDLAAMLATLVDASADAGRSAQFEGPRHSYIALRGLAMKRAFTNVIDNALTYGVTARVTLRDAEGEVRVSVDDDGPGIPEHEFDRVFQPFTRLDASRNRQTGGVGLGLAIVRQAVEREGGTVTLSNRAEGGLRAEIAIPRRSNGVVPSSPRPGWSGLSSFVTKPHTGDTGRVQKPTIAVLRLCSDPVTFPI